MRSRLTLAGIVAGALVLAPVTARADELRSSVGASGTTTLTLVNGQAATPIAFHVQATGNGGCDVSTTRPGQVAISIAGGPGLTASTSQLSFTRCKEGANDNAQTVTFTATQPGTYTVMGTPSGGTPDNQSWVGVSFTVRVNGPSNTAPNVAVTGVSQGSSYEHGSVPVAQCQVSDTQDGSSTTPASLSAITGPLAAYGLGQQTATCTHTDLGGLAAAPASATYTIVDTTAPSLSTPGDQVLEATGPGGAVATFEASASDAVGLDGDATCEPASGATFPLGETEVTCTVTDVAGNESSGTFEVTVQDTTAPSLLLGNDVTVEATGPDGAVAAYDASADDTVDGPVLPECEPPSGSVFALGATTVACSATDSAGNVSTGALTVTVVDTTPPVLSLPAPITAEAASPAGSVVDFTATASDLVDGAVDVSCTPASGSTFALGTTVVTCSATDAAGNSAVDTVEVTVEDTTAPELTVPGAVTAEATGPAGAVVDFEASATDAVDTAPVVSCIPGSGSAFALGATTVNCTAEDASGNTSIASFVVTVVDTTAPLLAVPGDLTRTATSAAGAPVDFTATATDLVDGAVIALCRVGDTVVTSGATFAPGTSTVVCTATDAAGNVATATFAVTVSFAWNGFFAPVDMGGVLNTIKGGSSVPLKWSITDGSGGHVSSLAVVSAVRQARITCATNAVTDDIEAPTSGATVLRYDATANQYVYNWQSPKGAGVCYRLTVTLTDGTSRSADFKTR